MTRRLLGPTGRVWFWFVLAGTLLGAAIAGGVSVLAPSGYTARVTVLVTPTPTGSAVTSSDLQIAQAYIPTLAELATIRPVLTGVISKTGIAIDPQELASAVSTHVPADTSLLAIAVSNPSAANAASLANAIATELKGFLPSAGSPASGNLRLVLTVVDPAVAPTTRDGPGLPLRVVLGGAIAFFLAVSLAFLVENAGRGAQNLGRGIERLGRRPHDAEPAAAPEPAQAMARPLFGTATQRPWMQPAQRPDARPAASLGAAFGSGSSLDPRLRGTDPARPSVPSAGDPRLAGAGDGSFPAAAGLTPSATYANPAPTSPPAGWPPAPAAVPGRVGSAAIASTAPVGVSDAPAVAPGAPIVPPRPADSTSAPSGSPILEVGRSPATALQPPVTSPDPGPSATSPEAPVETGPDGRGAAGSSRPATPSKAARRPRSAEAEAAAAGSDRAPEAAPAQTGDGTTKRPARPKSGARKTRNAG